LWATILYFGLLITLALAVSIPFRTAVSAAPGVRTVPAAAESRHAHPGGGR
jgi:hypothetical protein